MIAVVKKLLFNRNLQLAWNQIVSFKSPEFSQIYIK
jgi:hypothetical protein